MKFLLDTNICIYVIKRKPIRVLERFRTFRGSELGISTVTLSELQYGVEKSSKRPVNQEALDKFTTPLAVSPYDESAARLYGVIRTDLERRGQLIGAMDLMIAAHALSLRIPLITNNTREFERVGHLIIENWI